MTSAEIIRHLEADLLTGYPSVRESMQPLPDVARTVHCIGYILRNEFPLPPELSIAIRRLILTLLEAE